MAAIDKADELFMQLGRATGSERTLAADLEEVYGILLDGVDSEGAFGLALCAMGIPPLAPPPRTIGGAAPAARAARPIAPIARAPGAASAPSPLAPLAASAIGGGTPAAALAQPTASLLNPPRAAPAPSPLPSASTVGGGTPAASAKRWGFVLVLLSVALSRVS